MSPLLVSTLSYLGNEVLDRLLPSPVASGPVQSADFQRLLRQVNAPTSTSLPSYLETHGITNTEQLGQHLQTLQTQLRQHPDLPIEARSLLQSPDARLQVSPQGQFSIAQDHLQASLPSTGPLAELATQIHQLASLQQAHGLSAGTDLRTFASVFQPAHSFTASWALN